VRNLRPFILPAPRRRPPAGLTLRALRGALVLALLCPLALVPPIPAGAQAPVPPAPAPPAGVEIGALPVTGETWNFDGDAAAGPGPWGSVTVTNTSCETPYRPGTAQAGAIIFTASLQATPSQSGQAVFQGDLLPFVGSAARGHVRVLTPTEAPAPTTHVDASLAGLEPFAQGTTLRVCLTPAGAAVTLARIVADAQQVVARGYDPAGVVTTLTADGRLLVAIAGSRLGSADGSPQWVFFFLDTTYLGTDTAAPSPQLQLAGSPGPGQVSVQYTNYAPGDPLCCPSQPPVTVTYTWTGTALVPDGTPPGH
jgi:hypothetical protein